jgi:hypothetical protein
MNDLINAALKKKFKPEFLRNYFNNLIQREKDQFMCNSANGPIRLVKTAQEYFGFCEEKYAENYNRQISGSGKESGKIDSIESSSCLAFSCFCNVDENHPITIEVDGDLIQFTQCYFEVQNRVITIPSNIDILLINYEKNILLYLESKFTEYICQAHQAPTIIGTKYFSNYETLMNQLSEFVDVKSHTMIPQPAIPHIYYDGIKQMISHFIGVCQGPAIQDKLYFKFHDLWKKSKIYLGTILYKFPGDEGNESYIECYSKLYSQLSNTLNRVKFEDQKNVHILNQVLTYQDVFAHNPDILSDKIAQYYQLGEKV